MTDDSSKPLAAPKPSWGRRLRSWLLDLMVIIAIIAAVHFWQTRDMLLGPAPPLPGTGPDLHADRLLPASPEQARLVVFWAEWCPVCRLELGTLERLSRDYRVQTVASQSGDRTTLAAFMQEQAVHFPVWVDDSGQLAADWQVRGFPALFVIDPSGQIRYRFMGFSTGLGIRLRLWLASL